MLNSYKIYYSSVCELHRKNTFYKISLKTKLNVETFSWRLNQILAERINTKSTA
jgi:hypothetical protein